MAGTLKNLVIGAVIGAGATTTGFVSNGEKVADGVVQIVVPPSEQNKDKVAAEMKSGRTYVMKVYEDNTIIGTVKYSKTDDDVEYGCWKAETKKQ